MLGFQYNNHFNLIGAWNTADLLNNTELGTSVHWNSQYINIHLILIPKFIIMDITLNLAPSLGNKVWGKYYPNFSKIYLKYFFDIPFVLISWLYSIVFLVMIINMLGTCPKCVSYLL